MHISHHNFFQKVRRGEGAGTEILKLFGVAGLRTDNDFKKAEEFEFCELFEFGEKC